MKVIVSGTGGLLGADLAAVLSSTDEVVAVEGRRQADLTDFNVVRALVESAKPDAFVHAAGLRHLDECERDPERAYRANVLSTRNICLAMRRVGGAIVYISSDCVFDGRAGPYHEFADPCPINVYGRTKLRAEQVIQALMADHYIVRMPLLFGLGGRRDDNLVLRTLERLNAGEEVKVSGDQVTGPTYTVDAARAVAALLRSKCCGIYHVANAGEASKAEFLAELARRTGTRRGRITPVPVAQLQLPAPRPLYTALYSICLGQTIGFELPDWRQALDEMLASEAWNALRRR